MKRHPELSKRKPQALQMVKAKAATPEVVNHWFHQCLKPALDGLGLMDKPALMKVVSLLVVDLLM